MNELALVRTRWRHAHLFPEMQGDLLQNANPTPLNRGGSGQAFRILADLFSRAEYLLE
jgi:hypothetical protein